MPELLKKSQLNIESARLLIENGFYAPSIHCSYYASFLLLKHVICYSEGSKYEDLERELGILKSKNHKIHVGIHEFLIDIKLPELIKREKIDYEIKRKIQDLKVVRVMADYQNTYIKQEISEKAFEKSDFIVKNLNDIISNGS